MPRLRKAAGILVTIAALTALLGAGCAYLSLRPVPPLSGRLAVQGLAAPVEVIRDRWGIPHIYAANDVDLFFAQGYVQAQDRLWQLELNRRAARGTLAEVLGERSLASDRLAKTLGFGQAADAEWPRLEPDVRAALESYARGVNAYLRAAGGRLPLEFRLLGFRPAPWRPEDSLAWARLLAWSESPGWQRDLLRARLVQAVGPERVAQLELGDIRRLSLPGELGDLAVLEQPLLLEEGAEGWPWAPHEGGSAWAVDGTRSASGRPILAGAAGSEVQMPSAWYEVQLVGGSYDVIGAAIPGLPGVAIGRNQTVAWALAAGPLDGEDLFVERVRPGEKLLVEYQGQWEEAQLRQEEIHVLGRSEPVRLDVWTTRHGPLVSSLPAGEGEAVALRWVGAEEPTGLVPGLLALGRATNWQEFQAALRGWTTPAHTLVYADAAGNIGYALTGAAPLRAHGDGGFPAPGWTGGYEWQGLAPARARPAGPNPGQVVASFGAPLKGEGYPGLPLGEGGGARDQRLTALLAAPGLLRPEDAQAMLTDLRGPEQALLARLLALPAQDWVQERTTPHLRDWDLRYDRESAGAGVFEVYCWRLAHNMLDDELGPRLVDQYLELEPNQRAVMERMAAEPGSSWYDDIRTPVRETCDEVMARSYAEALEWLGRRYGDLPYEWNWGRVHNITFTHALGVHWPFTLLYNRGAMRADGGPLCLNEVGTDYGARLAVSEVPSYRLVVDLGEGGQAMSANAGGQSGNPFSRHYADMIEPWRAGRYHPLLYRREDVLKAGEATLALVPGVGNRD